jgi:hypothetical protein
VTDHAFAFGETSAAMDRVASGHSRGKVVIQVSSAASTTTSVFTELAM